MRRRALIVAVLSSALAFGSIAGAQASTPPGQRGYEGQPGHQGGGNHAPGLRGYEGQPGNQGG